MPWKGFWIRNSKELNHLRGWLGLASEYCTYVIFSSIPRQENIDKKNQHKLIQCLKAFMNNKVRNIFNLYTSSMIVFWFQDECGMLKF